MYRPLVTIKSIAEAHRARIADRQKSNNIKSETLIRKAPKSREDRT